MAAPAGHAISFGTFRLLPAQRLLLENGKPVRVGSRALDILIALAERPAELISKEELIARAWPDTFVDEGNLRVHIAALRRALGDGQAGNRYIANIPGRGYRFVAPVSRTSVPETSESIVGVAQTYSLPPPPMRMLGRADVVGLIATQLLQRRFVTLAGPGGIGKTTVALAVANNSSESYEDGVRFVDLAPLTDPRLVPSALASVLGLAVRSDNPIPALVAFLRSKHMLLVLDNCEHVIDVAAILAEQVLSSAPKVHVLATSREALRARGERVLRIGPLEVPIESSRLSAAEALAYPAVQLFVERVAENLDGFELSDADAPIVADICRRLDGIALAIELAAGRVDAFGVYGVAALLDDRFRLLTRGRRTALPRHQTLAATLDWSYEALPLAERAILRRLAIFTGAFTPESASVLAAGPEVDASDVIDGVANLVAKSLVVADVGGADVHYRLLETMRAYAFQKLTKDGEFEPLARRHAQHYRDLFERAEAERAGVPAAQWLARYGHQIGNVRSALDWAFSSGGDAPLGVALTIAAVPLWIHLSLNEECLSRVETALANLRGGAEEEYRREMQLCTARGGALMYTAGSGPETNSSWRKAYSIAEEIGDPDYQLRALWGLWTDTINRRELRAGLALAEKFRDIAVTSADVADPLIGDRMLGLSLYFLGELTEARLCLERMLSRYVAPASRLHIVRYQFDQRILARITLAAILWLQGFPDQARNTAEGTIEDALAIDHPISLTYALAQSACPIALETGDLDAAERFLKLINDQASRFPSAAWDLWSRCLRGKLLIKRGDFTVAARVLAAALDEFPMSAFNMRYTSVLGELAEASGRIGDIPKALTAIDEALEHSNRCEERWHIADLLRIKGDILLRVGTASAARAAGEHFLQSLDWARRQGVLSWELRTATSLARSQRDQGRLAEARDQLATVYGRFSEGFGTSDLRKAKQLLDELGQRTDSA